MVSNEMPDDKPPAMFVVLKDGFKYKLLADTFQTDNGFLVFSCQGVPVFIVHSDALSYSYLEGFEPVSMKPN